MRKDVFRRFFQRFFPVPYFLAPPSFGIDISDESLKFVELTNTRKGVRIGRYGEEKIAPGIIKSGKIEDTHKMEKLLLSLRKKHGIRSVRVSLPEEQVYLFKLSLKKEGLEHVRENIELVLEEHIPIPALDAIFDYDILSEDDENLELQVAAIPKNIIDGYMNLFKNSQIMVQSFELEAQAISRAVVKKGDLDTYMIVDFGKKRTGIFILSRGIVVFASTLDLGGMMLTDMIAKNFGISQEEAEEMKKKYGLQRNVANREIFSVLLNSVSVLRDEIVKHFLYWHTHKDEKGKDNPKIKKIILCGGDANLIGLPDYFSISMKNKVEVADVWTNIINTDNHVPIITFEQSLAYSSALGLALGNFEDN